MERDFAGSKLSQDDFERLAATCSRCDAKFPKTFADWQRLVADGVLQLARDGKTAPEFAIDPDSFITWSQRVGVIPCLDSLRAYLIIYRGPTISSLPAAQSVPAASPKSPDGGPSSSRVLGDLIAGILPRPTPAWR